MNIKVLSLKKSRRPISDTKLSSNGFVKDYISGEQSYELRIDLYKVNNIVHLPEKTIVVGENHYKFIFDKYSIDDLIAGVRIESLFSIIEPIEIDASVLFEEEIELIVKNIVDELPFMISGIDNYNGNLRNILQSFMERQILSLRNKFKIEPK